MMSLEGISLRFGEIRTLTRVWTQSARHHSLFKSLVYQDFEKAANALRMQLWLYPRLVWAGLFLDIILFVAVIFKFATRFTSKKMDAPGNVAMSGFKTGTGAEPVA